MLGRFIYNVDNEKGNFRTEFMSDNTDSWETLFDRADEDGRDNSLFYALSNIENRYAKPEIAGSGAMKNIIRTEDMVSGRVIAKAVLKNPDDDQTIESFLREARITAKLQHPNIVPLYDMGLDEDGQPFFTMKLIKGLTLKDILDKLKKEDAEFQQGYSLPKRIDIFLKVCDALAYAHSQGIAHLDLKPENITVCTYGDVVVCDWGLAAVIGDNEGMSISLAESIDYYSKRYFTLCGEIKGTPGYMSPEQAKGGIEDKDERSDIYALGSIFYELLTLKNAIDGEDLKSVISRTIKGTIIAPSMKRPELTIPSSLEAICMKALKLKPEDRYQSVEEIINDIDAYRLGFVTEAEDFSFSKQLYLLYKRNKQICLVAIFLTSVIIVGSVFFIDSLQTEKALTEKAHEKVERAYEKVDKLSKDASENQATKGRLAYFRFQIAKAKDFLESSSELNPQNFKALAYLSKVLAVQQDFSAAYDKLLEAHAVKDDKGKAVDKDLIKFFEVMKEHEYKKPLGIQEIYSYVQEYVMEEERFVIKAQFYAWAIMNEVRTPGNEIVEIEKDINWLLSQENKTEISGKLKIAFEGYKYDVSGHYNLLDIRSIAQLPLTHLDIRRCLVKDMALTKELAHSINMDSFRTTKVLNIDRDHKFTPIHSGEQSGFMSEVWAIINCWLVINFMS